MKKKPTEISIDDVLSVDLSAIPLPDDKIEECRYFLTLASEQEDSGRFRWLISAYLNAVYSYFEIKALGVHEAYTNPETAEPIADSEALEILRQYIRIVQQKNNPSFVKTGGLNEITAQLYNLRRQNTHHYPLAIMQAGNSLPEDFEFGHTPGKGVPALAFCRKVMAIIDEIERRLSESAL
jgi:hypothetical protein